MRHTGRHTNERGVAFIEMSISLMVCVLLLLSIMDVALVLKRYVAITRIAYEGVRLASDHSRLTKDMYSNANADSDMTHSELHRKIEEVLKGYNYNPKDFNVYTRRFEDEDRVQVRIVSPPLNFFNRFLNSHIVVSSTVDGPYLYINEDDSA